MKNALRSACRALICFLIFFAIIMIPLEIIHPGTVEAFFEVFSVIADILSIFDD